MTNVPLYAYAFGLLAFGAPLASAACQKNEFFDKLKKRRSDLLRFLLLSVGQHGHAITPAKKLRRPAEIIKAAFKYDLRYAVIAGA